VGSPHQERIEQLIAAWNGREFDLFFSMLADDVEVITDPRWPEPGPYQGAAARKFIEDWIEAWDTDRVEIHDFTTVDERVVARCTWGVKGTASGAAVTLDLSFVFTFDDAMDVLRIHVLFEHERALEIARAN
jgi:hypothetical protein